MRRRTVLAGLATTLSGAGFLVGTQGFSTMEAEREINVDVVGDEDAVLRLRYPTQSIGCGQDEIQLVEIGNHTATDITSLVVTVESVPSGIELLEAGTPIATGHEIVVTDEDTDTPFSPGTEQHVHVTTSTGEACNGIYGVEFNVSASGPGIEINTTESRTVTVACDCSGEGETLDVQFKPNGNVVTFGTELSETVTPWYADGGDIDSEDVTVSGKEQLTNGDIDEQGSVDLVAIAFGETDPETLFVSPSWNGSEVGNGFEGACETSKDDIDDIGAFLDDGDNFPICDAE